MGNFRLPVTDRSKAVIWCNSYLNLIRESVSCRVPFSVVSYTYVSFSGRIISVGEERVNFSAIDYL